MLFRSDQEFEVPHVDQRERGLAGDEDQLPPFLEHDIGATEHRIGAQAVGDPAERAHAAGDDHHRIERVRAAGEGDVHAFESVLHRSRGQAQSARQLLLQDGMRVVAEDDVHLVCAGVEVVEQPLRVKRPARTRDGDDDSQARRLYPRALAAASRAIIALPSTSALRKLRPVQFTLSAVPLPGEKAV